MAEEFFVIAGFMGLGLMLLLITILMTIVVYIDAQKRYLRDSMLPLLWAVIVLLTNVIGLIAYLIARPSENKNT